MWTAKIVEKKIRQGQLVVTLAFESAANAEESFNETLIISSNDEPLRIDKYCAKKLTGLEGLTAYSQSLDNKITVGESRNVTEVEDAIAAAVPVPEVVLDPAPEPVVEPAPEPPPAEPPATEPPPVDPVVGG